MVDSIRLLRARAHWKAQGAATTSSMVGSPPGRRTLDRNGASALRKRPNSKRANRARSAIQAELDATVAQLGDEEVGVLGLLACRLLEGMTIYGQLDLARDRRDFDAERAEEIADLLNYGAMAELRRVLLARGRR